MHVRCFATERIGVPMILLSWVGVILFSLLGPAYLLTVRPHYLLS